MQAWLIDNSALLSGIAAIVCMVAAVLTPTLPAIFKRRADATPNASIPTPPVEPKGLPANPVIESPQGPPSLAVMPFDRLSVDVDDAYLADGIACEVIAALSRSSHVRVVPRTDSFALRGRTLSVTDIGRELAARYVVTGSVRRTATRVRVIAEFAEAANGRQLWTKTYEHELADVLRVQSDIAQVIAGAIGGEAFRAEVINLRPATNNLDAWSLTQKARHDYMVAHGPTAIVDAAELALQATRKDPDYALAQALLAMLLMDLVSTAVADDPDEARRDARIAIERALHLAGDQPEVLTYAGRVWMELGERVRAVEALRHATRLSPYDLMECGFLARALAFGSQTEAAEGHEIAARLIAQSPEHPCVWTWELFAGLALMNLERYAESRAPLAKACQQSPKFVRAWMSYASALGANGELAAARTAAAKATDINSAFTPQQFARYVGMITQDTATTARLTRGLVAAELLSA